MNTFNITNKIIFHIDVNNAFLSWTAIDLLEKGHTIDIRDTYSIISRTDNKRHRCCSC